MCGGPRFPNTSIVMSVPVLHHMQQVAVKVEMLQLKTPHFVAAQAATIQQANRDFML